MGGKNNSWQALAEQAGHGRLRLEPGTVELLAKQVGDTIARVRAVRAKISMVDSLARFSGADSGEALAAKNSGRAAELGTILDLNLEILHDMADAFFAAGKAYADAEDISGESLRKIRPFPMPTAPGSFHNNPPAAGSSRPPTYPVPTDATKIQTSGLPRTHLPPGLAALTGKNRATVRAETPEHYPYSWFYNLGKDINPQLVADAAAIWTWMSGELKDEYDKLGNNFVAAEAKWEGAGKTMAITASRAYSTGTLNLTRAMSSIGANLYYTSGWLAQTKPLMPTSAQPPPAPYAGTMLASPAEDPRIPHITALHEWYVPGVSDSDLAVPALPIPVSPINTGPPGPPGPGFSTGPGPVARPASATDDAQQQWNARQEDWQEQQARQIAQQRAQDAQEQARRAAQERTQAAQEQARRAAQERARAAQERQRAAQQREQAAQQREQAAQQQEQQAAQQRAQAAQQAQEAAQQAGQQAAGAAQQAAQQAAQEAAQRTAQQAAQRTASSLASGLGAGPGKAAGPGPGAKSPSALNPLDKASKLFPRASAAGATGAIGRAGAAPMAATPGSPGAAGSAGRGAGQEDKDYKKSAFLESTDYLDEAMGGPQLVAKPVLDQ
ncbi:hypothetical protein AB0B25_07255 [Nocardia sp. NPDC049190]|uniref:hypothetical protein n=1 Tax=Nocardia sp. NPDC049190 TaxID=3155650 RepID=UPI0033D0ACE4